MRKLTPKQQRFVDEYLVDLNATGAARRAGYSSNRASEIGWQLLQKTTVQQAIAAAQAKRSAVAQVTSAYVLERLKGEAELTGEGSSHGARVKAIELLGIHLGMFKRKLELSGEVRQRVVEEIVDADHRDPGQAAPPAAGVP